MSYSSPPRGAVGRRIRLVDDDAAHLDALSEFIAERHYLIATTLELPNA